jgi:anti-sigma factor RsiW
MMSCEHSQERMTEKLEGELLSKDALVFERHMDGCPACRSLLGELGEVKALLSLLPRETVPSYLPGRISLALASMLDNESDDLGCEIAQEWLSEYLEDALLPLETLRLEMHLETCDDCGRALAGLKEIEGLLALVPTEPVPDGLAERIHAALEALPADIAFPRHSLPSPPPSRGREQRGGWRLHWRSALVGGAVAAAALGFAFWSAPALHVPTIETAAVTVKQDVAVNIGFDVASTVDNVTFQIDLPEGLQFIDDHAQPLAAQSVSWRGSLKAGKTVVPILVRGVRPGRYAIEAYVKKGAMMRKTTIMLPVTVG